MRKLKNIIASFMAAIMILSAAFCAPVSAWNASPSTTVDMSLKLLGIGPNNEVYLSPGQSLVFNVANSELADLLFAVEAKALSGSSTMSVSIDGNDVSEAATQISSNSSVYM